LHGPENGGNIEDPMKQLIIGRRPG